MYVPVAPNVITFEAIPWIPVTPLDTALGSVNVCATLATVTASWILPFAPLGLHHVCQGGCQIVPTFLCPFPF